MDRYKQSGDEVLINFYKNVDLADEIEYKLRKKLENEKKLQEDLSYEIEYKQLVKEQEKLNCFAINSMKELLVKSGECCDICLEEFEIDKIEIRPCWHRCCTSCSSKLDKCHVCRQ